MYGCFCKTHEVPPNLYNYNPAILLPTEATQVYITSALLEKVS